MAFPTTLQNWTPTLCQKCVLGAMHLYGIPAYTLPVQIGSLYGKDTWTDAEGAVVVSMHMTQ